jgi:hypothetical protein
MASGAARNGKHVLRERLADSHVAAIAVAALLVWSLDAAFRAVLAPLGRVVDYLANAIGIFGFPYFSFTHENYFILLNTLSYLVPALCNFAAAWGISHWVYGTRPLNIFSLYRARFARRKIA